MRYMSASRRLALLSLAAVVIAGICWAAGGSKLYMNGKLASSNLRVIDGRSYVPVADVAKALGAEVTARSDGYEIAIAGGTGQVEGFAQGKIGNELFTGQWRFQVVSVENAGDQYKERYYQQMRTLKPKGATDTLIVVNCRLKNGTKQTKTPLVTERIPGNTSLADDQDHSYPPLDYDAAQDEGDKIMSYAGSPLLPGAATDFALIFSVPKGTNPKALVYSVQVYPDDVGKDKHTDLRVSLTP